MSGYIYIIQLASFVKENKNVYKIGMTQQDNPLKRLKNYDRDYSLIYSEITDDVKNKEKEILKAFNDKFTPYRIGDYEKSKEYFIGNKDKMKQIAQDICNNRYKEETTSTFWKILGY